MTVDFRFVVVAGVLGALVPMPAVAQTATSGLVKSASMAAASVKPAAGPAGKWTCVSSATVEIAPVSFDTGGQASAWVMVHRVQGEVIAAERISQREAEQLRRLPCGTRDSDEGGVARIG